MDYGLLGAFGQGVQAFNTARQSKLDREEKRRQSEEEAAMKRRSEQMTAADKGLVEDAETKGFIQSDSRKAKEELERHKTQAEIDELKARSKRKSEGSLADEIARLRLEEARRRSADGTRLPADKVLSVQDGNRIPTMLQDLRNTIGKNKDAFGPVTGRLGAMNPWNERSQTIDAQMRSAAQSFGRFMEGGVLRKEDEEKYRKMFPDLKDTPDVAANKLALVDRLLQQKQQGDTAALQSAGYNTGGLMGGGGLVPEPPSILSGPKDSGGLIPSAQADSDEEMREYEMLKRKYGR